MARAWPHAPPVPSSLTTSYIPAASQLPTSLLHGAQDIIITRPDDAPAGGPEYYSPMSGSSTGKGILIGILSAFGSAAFVAVIILIIYFFQYTQKGRIFLDRIGRPGEYDDEQAFAKEEAEALEEMDDMQRMEYMRAKAFVQANPPESVQTDISLSQFLAIQEKGVSAWEFEPELEIANCFVEARTEIEFFDAECSVQSNLPIPKQNEVYYFEAKIYDKPENTLLSIGVTTKPYPLFRLPGWHKHSLAYTSTGVRRHNQPFHATPYAPPYVQGDVIGVGYRPRTGTVFFTRNGKKLDDVAHGLKTQNFFPTVGANGPCQVHVNFGQLGFVFIEANVKKWGLAPMTGSLAPPPPYGSEQGSILLEGGREGVREGMGGGYMGAGSFHHGRSASQQYRYGHRPPTSPGPQRSPTDISLAQLSLVDSYDGSDAGEGTSGTVGQAHPGDHVVTVGLGVDAPPDYESPKGSPGHETPPSGRSIDEDREPLLSSTPTPGPHEPPIPSYAAAVAEGRRGRSNTRDSNR
ncbi:SPRY-domain-containing protein [Aulographum hederae CBS 113979]|uniref:Protein SSH4 n=1 Tax=Aulographum hederae CBS 113979 TaxID=1176131 RepID=A0A6G1GZR4_9PEZI|nr:SPRY-domain-containing protein [Aulographum hederae CBS 113979]